MKMSKGTAWLIMIGLFVLFAKFVLSLAYTELPPEAYHVDVSVTQGYARDSNGRVEVNVKLTNNSNKTLTSGSYMIYSEDVSGTTLSSDSVYPKNVRSGGYRVATVWLKLPPGAKIRGSWGNARFK